MEENIERILLGPDAIRDRVAEIGRELTERFRGRDPLVIAVMKGCVLFLADLLRALPIPLDLEFVYCKSYDGTTSGRLEFAQRSTLPEEVRGRSVIVVDDIFDTGRTLAHVVDQLRGLGAADVTTVVLLEKRGAAAPGAAPADLVGFTVENLFVVGYGLDYNGRYRNLPHVGVLRSDVVEGT
jgi:hypoxanthine phosphoribosyltransferase